MAPEASFKVALYMRPFYPPDIHLTSTDNNSFIIHAKHDEHVDQHGIVKREVIREYKLPEGISIKMLKFEFTRNGIMIIRAVQADQIVVSKKSSEIKVKLTEKKDAPEKMECEGSPSKFCGIVIREKKKSESAEKSELAEQTIEEKQKIASCFGVKLDSTGEVIAFESDFEPSVQSSLADQMEVDVDAKTTPCPQSSSTEIIGDIEGIRGPPFPIIMKAMETTQSPPKDSSDTMEVTKNARSPQSSLPKVMEATEPAQSSESSSTDMMEVTKTARSPQSSLPKVMEATDPAQSPQSSSTDIMEVTKTARSPQSSLPKVMEATKPAQSTQSSSSVIMETTETPQGPLSSSGETMDNGGGST